jgi:hypothetical protein
MLFVLLALIFFVAWVATGRQKPIFLRLIGLCMAIQGILFILRAGR